MGSLFSLPCRTDHYLSFLSLITWYNLCQTSLSLTILLTELFSLFFNFSLFTAHNKIASTFFGNIYLSICQLLFSRFDDYRQSFQMQCRAKSDLPNRNWGPQWSTTLAFFSQNLWYLTETRQEICKLLIDSTQLLYFRWNYRKSQSYYCTWNWSWVLRDN